MKLKGINISAVNQKGISIVEVRQKGILLWPDSAPEPEPDIVINPETYQQDEKARDFDIFVDTLSYWEASINVGWVTLSQMTGPAGGVTIVASVALNATGQERIGVITFTTEFGQTTCTVTQTTP